MTNLVSRPSALMGASATLGVPAAVLGIGTCAAVAAVLLGPVALVLPFAVVGAVLLVRRPPWLLAAFLYVGIFKGQPPLSVLPFDITLVLGLLLVAVCFHRFLTDRALKPPVGMWGAMLVIGVFMAVSLTYTPDVVYGYGAEKVGKYFTFTLLAAAAPFFVIENARDLRHLLWAVVALAMGGALFALAFPGADSGRIEFGGQDNTIFTSRLLCSGALILLIGPRLLGLGRWMGVIGPLAGVGLLVVSAGIGSRGPLLSLVFAIVCVLAASVVRRPSQLVPVMLVVLAGVAVFPFVSLPETSRERLEKVVQNPVGSLEEDGRSILYRQAGELIEREPFRGIGTGGFFQYSYVLLEQEEKYPHNVFLELWSETGIVPALALVLSLLFLIPKLFVRAGEADGDDQRLIYVVAGLFLFNLFAVQFSGDINDNRTFWTAFGLAWLLARYGVPGREPRADAT